MKSMTKLVLMLALLVLPGCQSQEPADTDASEPSPAEPADSEPEVTGPPVEAPDEVDPEPKPHPPAETRPPPPPTAGLPRNGHGPGDAEDGDYTIVPVYYGTDRNLIATGVPGEKYGSERSTITYGSCNVSIPKDHRAGELEAPSLWKFWRFEFTEDPGKHVVLLSVNPTPADQFFSRLAGLVRGTPRKSAFVFVHGYNVSFEDAARRTAQMAYDLQFDGVPIFYSWPSNNSTAAYPRDEENVRWSEPHVRQFLADVLDRTPAQDIVLIAHSMGNRALTGAFGELVARNPDARKRFREIILAAPDIDAEIFMRDIAPRLVGTGDATSRVTLYASANDRALRASKTFHGYKRAGDTTGGAVLFPGIETIDASVIDTSLVGHSYYGESTSIISDMFYLLRSQIRACDRARLQAVTTQTGKLCTFRP